MKEKGRKREASIYVKLKFEKIWGRKSNTKREGWGKRIKGHRTIYTPVSDIKIAPPLDEE